MVVMALDHTRDYFHAPAFLYAPTDPVLTTVPIYITRWVTHYCAPVFAFLAGVSVFLVGLRKSKSELSVFLIKRGFWLVLIELTVVNFAWYFDLSFRTPGLFVIWVLGVSMIVLAGLIHLPQKVVAGLSILVILGHNMLDSIELPNSVLWAILHVFSTFKLAGDITFYTAYPIIPWFAVMSLGYCFGTLYHKSVDPKKRRSILTVAGIICILMFVVVRGINLYGNLTHWEKYETLIQTIMSFMNPAKYPPSLSYLMMTLGPSLILLAYSESWRGKIIDFFQVFGRVPFFYYVLHLYLIHILALIAAEISGFGWEVMILPDWVTEVAELEGYGFNLVTVYLVWIMVILLLYPLCKRFDHYKSNHKEKWWLSYL